MLCLLEMKEIKIERKKEKERRMRIREKLSTENTPGGIRHGREEGGGRRMWHRTLRRGKC